jgi:hypothetical protein
MKLVGLRSNATISRHSISPTARCSLPSLPLHHHHNNRLTTHFSVTYTRRSTSLQESIPKTIPRAASTNNETTATFSKEDIPIPADLDDYITYCQSEFGIDGLVEFSSGINGLPMAMLRHPSGAEADIYLHGACIAQLHKGDHKEMLWLASNNKYDGTQPIMGGVSLAWPQYGKLGPLPPNGILQNLHWSVIGTAAWETENDVPTTVALKDDSNEEEEEEEEEEEDEEEGDEENGGGGVDDQGGEQKDKIVQGSSSNSSGNGTGSTSGDSGTKRRRRKKKGKAVPVDAKPTISLYAASDESTLEEWPYKFEAVYHITLEVADEKVPTLNTKYGEDEPRAVNLRCCLHVLNAAEKGEEGGSGGGSNVMEFTAGLKNHFKVVDPFTEGKNYCKATGLMGKYYLDSTRHSMKQRLSVEQEDVLFFYRRSDIDRVYSQCPSRGEVLFCPGSFSHIKVHNAQGFTDMGVHHPGFSNPDFAAECVCMPAAKACVPVKLGPGEDWKGEMVLTCREGYWKPTPAEKGKPWLIPVPEFTEEVLPTRPALGSEGGTWN